MQLSHLSLLAPCYPPFKVTYFNSLITYLSQETRDKMFLFTAAAPIYPGCLLTRTDVGINVDYLIFWYSIRVKPCLMLCMSIMTNAYIIGFMSPLLTPDLSPIRPVFTQRAAAARRQNNSNQLIKSFSRLICLGEPVFK